jgi:hypothetical protein
LEQVGDAAQERGGAAHEEVGGTKEQNKSAEQHSGREEHGGGTAKQGGSAEEGGQGEQDHGGGVVEAVMEECMSVTTAASANKNQDEVMIAPNSLVPIEISSIATGRLVIIWGRNGAGVDVTTPSPSSSAAVG